MFFFVVLLYFSIIGYDIMKILVNTLRFSHDINPHVVAGGGLLSTRQKQNAVSCNKHHHNR